jgi:hypothetical protein
MSMLASLEFGNRIAIGSSRFSGRAHFAAGDMAGGTDGGPFAGGSL